MRNLIGKFMAVAAGLAFLGTVAFAQGVQFKVPITVTNGPTSTVLTIGISGDGPNPPGTLLDNTINFDLAAAVEATFADVGAPPTPPPPFAFDARLVTIPGRTATFPTGLGAGAFADYRGFSGLAQVDSFKITISGDDVDTAPTTLTWQAGLNTLATSWVIKPQTGTEWAQVDMGAQTTLTLPAGVSQRNIIIIKTGLNIVVPGPVFNAPASLAFGNVGVGGSATLALPVNNPGTTNALNISDIVVTGPFTFTPAAPQTVGAGATTNFNVVFSPIAGGAVTGTLVFTHNAPGSPTTIQLTGTGTSQGGTLNFAEPTRSRFDNTPGYDDSLGLTGYVGQPLKGLQLKIITQGLLTVRGVQKGRDIASPANAWNFNYVITRADTLRPDGSSPDTIKIVLYGNGNTVLAPGSYSNLIQFEYDVVNITNPDVQTTSIGLVGVLASLANGDNAQISAGPDQQITVNNRTIIGDVNNDDELNVLDLLEIVDHILEKDLLTGDSFTRADVYPYPTGDGVVSVQDLTLLQNIILTNQYPNGDPIGKTGTPLAVSTTSSNGLAKLAPGTDARLTFHITKAGVAVRLESAVAVKGFQADFLNVAVVPAEMKINTVLGEGYFNQYVPTSMRVLLYNQQSASIAAGEHLLALMPFAIADPTAVSVEGVVLATEDNKEVAKLEISISYDEAPELPVDYSLSQNYPNPFNPSTDIRFSVPVTADVTIKIFNALGQEVRTLVATQVERGTRVVRWDGRDNNGKVLSSGSYVYRMTAGSFVETKKMMLLK